MLKRNSIIFHSFGGCQKWEPAGRIGDFEILFNDFAKAHACFYRPEYLNEWNLCCKILKYCILSEVCMINSAPQSTVWPQMWCIRSIKGCFTCPQICWQVNLSNAQKIRPDLFSKNLFSRPNLLWSRAIMALECDRRWLLFFGCTYKAINSM